MDGREVKNLIKKGRNCLWVQTYAKRDFFADMATLRKEFF